MFPKCSLDVLNIAMLREHSVNISGILRAGWVIATIVLNMKVIAIERKPYQSQYVIRLSHI